MCSNVTLNKYIFQDKIIINLKVTNYKMLYHKTISLQLTLNYAIKINEHCQE